MDLFGLITADGSSSYIYIYIYTLKIKCFSLNVITHIIRFYYSNTNVSWTPCRRECLFDVLTNRLHLRGVFGIKLPDILNSIIFLSAIGILKTLHAFSMVDSYLSLE